MALGPKFFRAWMAKSHLAVATNVAALSNNTAWAMEAMDEDININKIKFFNLSIKGRCSSGVKGQGGIDKVEILSWSKVTGCVFLAEVMSS